MTELFFNLAALHLYERNYKRPVDVRYTYTRTYMHGYMHTYVHTRRFAASSPPAELLVRHAGELSVRGVRSRRRKSATLASFPVRGLAAAFTTRIRSREKPERDSGVVIGGQRTLHLIERACRTAMALISFNCDGSNARRAGTAAPSS